MTDVDVSKVSPADVAATVRSLPRRFAAVFAPLDDNVERISHRPPEPGRPPAEQCLRLASAGLDQVTRALRTALVHNDADVSIPAAASADVGVDRNGPSLESSLEELTRIATALADVLGRVDAHEWGRRARLDGHDTTILGLARQAVRIGVGRLREAEAAMADARGRAG